MKMKTCVISIFAVLLLLSVNVYAEDDGLPIVVPDLPTYPHDHCSMTFSDLNNITGGNEEGLLLDIGKESIWGRIYISQYPFEAGISGYDHSFFIDVDESGFLSEGKGVIPIAHLYEDIFNANNWGKNPPSSMTPTVEYRLDLLDGSGESDSFIGMYGNFVSFERDGEGMFRKLPTIVDGPYVTLICSDDPTSATIVWETDEPCLGEVQLGSQSYNEEGGETEKHSVRISGLTPVTEYDYYVRSVASDGRAVRSNDYTFRTAPEKGAGDVVFAYSSDSRTGGGGGGERDYMGVNMYILKQIAADMHRRNTDFLLFGGDLVYGISTSKEDLILQLKAWKQVMAPYWRSRPVYTGMGNHEIVMNFYGATIMDKWPYETESAEAVFGSEMFNPTEAPELSDARRPSYEENVYAFQYGPVKVISFNNTYWTGGLGLDSLIKYGGAPWGYIMEDQLEWIEDTIADAHNDPTVKFIFLFAHTPVFPYSRHATEAMWWSGSNNQRAYTKNAESGEVEPEELGILEVRDRFWKAVSSTPKSVAVFTGDEHIYHRILIDSSTKVGVYPADDLDGDGILDQYSSNPDFIHPVWHIVSGGGGAPHVSTEGGVPWDAEFVSSDYGYMLVSTEGNKAKVDFIANRSGEVQDSFEFFYDAAPTVINKTSGSKKITVSFSEPMDESSLKKGFAVKITIPGLGYGTVSGEVETDESGTTAVFVPTADLISGMDYTVNIKDAQGADGKPLEFSEWSLPPLEMENFMTAQLKLKALTRTVQR